MLSKIKKIFLIVGGLIVVSLIFYIQAAPSEELVVTFLNVGQGDAILIEAPEGQNILIDGGADRAVLAELGQALPFWERKIDLMILTHPHADHVAGLVAVVKRYEVGQVFTSGVLYTAPDYLKWLEEVVARDIPVEIIKEPMMVELAANLTLEILAPLEDFFGKKVENANNVSLVAKLTYGEVSFMLSGDAEVEEEEEILASGADLRAQILKAGHHGSHTSTSQKFLEAVAPEVVIISVGVDNAFAHPSARILKRLERFGAEIFRTDLQGAVEITSDGLEYKIKTEYH